MRRHDWEERLSAYIAEVSALPYVYGSHDCALFAAGAVEAVRGDDPASEFRGTYDSAASARESLKAKGKGTLLRTLRAKFKEKPVGFAQRGDLVMHGPAVGVCVGSDALFVTDDGLTRVPRAQWKRAFSV